MAMSNGTWRDSEGMWTDINETVTEIKEKLTRMEFLVNPVGSFNGAPYGFYTLGFTKVLLPEIYVSGMAINSQPFRELYPFISSLYTYLNINGCALHPSGEICQVINDQLTIAGLTDFQARPIDPARLMYGQALLLRHWAADEGIVADVDAIQIVHRINGTPNFPMVSTENQLLVDYVPFGTPCPEPIGL